MDITLRQLGSDIKDTLGPEPHKRYMKLLNDTGTPLDPPQWRHLIVPICGDPRKDVELWLPIPFTSRDLELLKKYINLLGEAAQQPNAQAEQATEPQR